MANVVLKHLHTKSEQVWRQTGGTQKVLELFFRSMYVYVSMYLMLLQ